MQARDEESATLDDHFKFNHIRHRIPQLKQVTKDGFRFYTDDMGKRYPSVTTVLSNWNKKQLNEWKRRVGEKKAERISRVATERGTSVHEAIEKFLLNEDVPEKMFPNVKSVYVAIKQELLNLQNIHALETRMYSPALGIAGTVDCIAEYHGKLSVIDFKTAKRFKKEEHIHNYFMQGAAYAAMFYEHTGIPVADIVILIGVDGSPVPQVFTAKVGDWIEPLKEYIHKYFDESGFSMIAE